MRAPALATDTVRTRGVRALSIPKQFTPSRPSHSVVASPMVAVAQPEPRNRLRRRRCHPKSDLPRSSKTRSGLRSYSPDLGRWNRRDQAEETVEVHRYTFVRNTPLHIVDGLGLWGTDVHKTKTIEWLTGTVLEMPATGANAIGDADSKVDELWNPSEVSDGNWKWHFNRSSGEDSRKALNKYYLQEAEWRCNWVSGGYDDWKKSAERMGWSLHPLQDFYAHGDYNAKTQLPNPAAWSGWPLSLWHNWDAPYWGSTSDPDDPAKDALMAPGWSVFAIDGRPTIPGMANGSSSPGAGTTYWARYGAGTTRIDGTKNETTEKAKEFMAYVDRYGKPCGECRRHFLP